MHYIKKKKFPLKTLIFCSFLSLLLIPWTKAHAAVIPPEQMDGEVPLVSPYGVLNSLSKKSVQGMALEAISLSPTEATPEIKELARGLKNDPDLIYKYVYDHIEYTPIYGSIKGATGTIVDGRGNDFDQSSLMIALLREAGYTANFIYGIIRLDPEQITNWLGTNNDPYVVAKVLAYAGIDAAVSTSDGTFDGDLLYVDLLHVWVKVDIDGNDYVFDPSFKTYSYKSPIDLASAMGYDRNIFLTSALNGTTMTFVNSLTYCNYYINYINTAYYKLNCSISLNSLSYLD